MGLTRMMGIIFIMLIGIKSLLTYLVVVLLILRILLMVQLSGLKLLMVRLQVQKFILEVSLQNRLRMVQ